MSDAANKNETLGAWIIHHGRKLHSDQHGAAYRTITARLVVFKTYEESAHERNLTQRLTLACLPKQ